MEWNTQLSFVMSRWTRILLTPVKSVLWTLQVVWKNSKTSSAAVVRLFSTPDYLFLKSLSGFSQKGFFLKLGFEPLQKDKGIKRNYE